MRGEQILRHIDDITPFCNQPWRAYTDRLYTSINIGLEFARRGYGLTGTMKYSSKIVPAPCAITRETPNSEFPRGTVKAFIARDKHSDKELQTWVIMDLGRVNIVDTARGGKQDTREYKVRHGAGERTTYTYPEAKVDFNKFLSGVDIFDMLTCSRQGFGATVFNIATSKWTLRAMDTLFDILHGNAWIMYQEVQKLQPAHLKQHTHGEFLKELALELLEHRPIHQSGSRRASLQPTQRRSHAHTADSRSDVTMADEDDALTNSANFMVKGNAHNRVQLQTRRVNCALCTVNVRRMDKASREKFCIPKVNFGCATCVENPGADEPPRPLIMCSSCHTAWHTALAKDPQHPEGITFKKRKIGVRPPPQGSGGVMAAI